MGRRRRRHDTDWAPFALMGLAALMSLFRGRRGPTFDARDVASPFRPVFTVISLVAAFVALGVLLTVLSAISALGGGGALAVGCGMPVLFIAFIAWLVSQRPKQHAVPHSDPWTIDGTASEGGEAHQERVAPPATALPPRWPAQPTTGSPAARPGGTGTAGKQDDGQTAGHTRAACPFARRVPPARRILSPEDSEPDQVTAAGPDCRAHERRVAEAQELGRASRPASGPCGAIRG